jgi:hypothetical protein
MLTSFLIVAAASLQGVDPVNFILTFPEAAILFGSQALAFLAYGGWIQRQHSKQLGLIRADNAMRLKQAEERAEQAEERSREAERRMQARLDFVMDFYIRHAPGVSAQSATVMADSQVLDVLMSKFDGEELKMLAFDLGVSWDNLPGDSIPTRAMHLVQQMRNTDRMQQLVEAINRRRPGVFK